MKLQSKLAVHHTVTPPGWVSKPTNEQFKKLVKHHQREADKIYGTNLASKL
jgi:hypothetical protein